MLLSQLDLSSRRGGYSGFCFIVSFAYVLLMSSGLAGSLNMTYTDLGTKKGESIANFGREFGYVVDKDAGTFVHLSSTATTVLVWVVLIGLALIVYAGVVQRSMAKTVVPCIVAILASALWQFDKRLDDNLAITAVGLMAMGAVAVIVLRRGYPAFIAAAPDAPPASPEVTSMTTSSA